MTYRKGDQVQLTYEGRTVEATVLMGSDNGRSLFLEFEALLGGHAGMMAVLERGGVYRALLDNTEVQLSGGSSRDDGA